MLFNIREPSPRIFRDNLKNLHIKSLRIMLFLIQRTYSWIWPYIRIQRPQRGRSIQNFSLMQIPSQEKISGRATNFTVGILTIYELQRVYNRESGFRSCPCAHTCIPWFGSFAWSSMTSSVRSSFQLLFVTTSWNYLRKSIRCLEQCGNCRRQSCYNEQSAI